MSQDWRKLLDEVLFAPDRKTREMMHILVPESEINALRAEAMELIAQSPEPAAYLEGVWDTLQWLMGMDDRPILT